MRTKKDLILKLLNGHRLMTLATNRPDGWPQATMVGYVNDGFLLYCFVARNSQKYVNIRRDPRVSAAIGSDAAHPVEIKGLSLAGRVTEVSDPVEFDHVARLRLSRYPEYADLPPPVLRGDSRSFAVHHHPWSSDAATRFRGAPYDDARADRETC